MPVNVRHELNTAAINSLLHGRGGGVARDLLRRGYRVAGAAQRRCPVDHGRLRSSIHARLVQRDGLLICEVGTDVKYAIFVHEGTGLYGPKHARIVPASGKIMVFTPRKNAGRYVKRGDRVKVFARSTQGMRGTPFLKDALPEARH
jgi:hypothetical protein